MKRYKPLIDAMFAVVLAVGLISCDNDNLESKVNEPIVKTIDGKEYKLEDNRIKELTTDQDNEAIYGVISDIHGEVEKARHFAQEFKKKGVNGIIIPGDVPLNKQLRSGRVDSRDDKIEIKEVLEAMAETGLPIFVIPGNHERKQDYENAIKELSKSYQNIFDMAQFRIFDGDDADFVSLPGYQTFKIPGRQFIPNDGYWAKPENVMEIKGLRQGLDDSVILITHGAGKTGSPGPATIYNGTDVGDELTTQIQKEANIPFAVAGHIHEAGGLAATFDGTPVKPNQWAKQFTANFGTLEKWKYNNDQVYSGMAGILTVKGDQAKYEIFVMK